MSHLKPAGQPAVGFPPVELHESKAMGGAAEQVAAGKPMAKEARRSVGVTRMAAPIDIMAAPCPMGELAVC